MSLTLPVTHPKEQTQTHVKCQNSPQIHEPLNFLPLAHITNSPLPITLPSQHHTLPSTYFYQKDKWALLGNLQPQSFYVPVIIAVFLAIPTSQFSLFRPRIQCVLGAKQERVGELNILQ